MSQDKHLGRRGDEGRWKVFPRPWKHHQVAALGDESGAVERKVEEYYIYDTHEKRLGNREG